MKKIILGLVAATAVAAPLAMSAPANAATANTDGSVTITKGDIQSRMGWNNDGWNNGTDTPAEVADLAAKITANDGMATPVDVPGGWLTLNGQIVANYPSDEYFASSFDRPENWGPYATPVSSYWTDSVDTVVTPVYEGGKLKGFKVSVANTAKDGYVHFTRHTTYTNPEYDGATYVYHAESRWPTSVAGSGSVSDVKVNGKAVAITPAV